MLDPTTDEGRASFEAMLGIFCELGHNGEIGLTYSDRGPDWLEYRLPWKEELTVRDGRIASSVIYSLLDSAAALLPFLVKGTDAAPYPTLELRVDHYRQPTPGKDLVVTGKSEKMTPDISFTKSVVHEGDPADPVAIGIGTFMSVKAFKE